MRKMCAPQGVCIAIMAAGLWSQVLSHSFAEAAQGPHLRVLLVGDTDDDTIGKSVSADLKHLKKALEYGIPSCRVEFALISAEDATPNRILDRLNSLRIETDDSLLVYYSGHGIVDPAEGHVLTMKRGNLNREKLLDAMRLKHAALTILVTDCCAIHVRAAAEPAAAPLNNWNIFRSLFFLHRGEIDINAAKEGTYAFCDLNGGVFTTSFCMALWRASESGSTRTAVTSWSEFFPKVAASTNAHAKDYLEWEVGKRGVKRLRQPSEGELVAQEPVLRSTALPIVDRLPRCGRALGVSTQSVPNLGLQITEVLEGSPAEWAGVQVGDCILELNGQPLASPSQLVEAVTRASKSQLSSGEPSSLAIRRGDEPQPIKVEVWFEQ